MTDNPLGIVVIVVVSKLDQIGRGLYPTQFSQRNIGNCSDQAGIGVDFSQIICEKVSCPLTGSTVGIIVYIRALNCAG